MHQRKIALKNFIFNLAVAKFLPVKMDGKCKIAPLDSIFWAFEIKLQDFFVFLKILQISFEKKY